MTEEIKKEPLGLGELVDSFHEFVPECYTLDTLDEHLLGANNAFASLVEELYQDKRGFEAEITRAYDNRDYKKLMWLINNLYTSIRSFTEIHMDYLEDEAEWTRNEILKKMEYQQECHEASEHFEDYMNVPFPEVYESREPDQCEIDLPSKQIYGTTLEECKEIHSDPIKRFECPVCKYFSLCYDEVTYG